VRGNSTRSDEGKKYSRKVYGIALPTKFSATSVAKDFFHGCAEDNHSQSLSMEDEFGLKNIEISTAEVSLWEPMYLRIRH